jgi:hypothetical protein
MFCCLKPRNPPDTSKGRAMFLPSLAGRVFGGLSAVAGMNKIRAE